MSKTGNPGSMNEHMVKMGMSYSGALKKPSGMKLGHSVRSGGMKMPSIRKIGGKR